MSCEINIQTAKQHIIDCIKVGLVPMIHGSPGTGKSAIIREIAEDFNLKLIDFRLSQCDPTDLLGFPDIDRENNKARYIPMDTIPLEGDEIPDGYDGWLVLFDELTSALSPVQAAAYKPLCEKEVGNAKVHPNVAMVAAGNLETDNAVVEPMSTALQSRLIHFEMVADHEKWIEWAAKKGLDHRITSYIKFKPDMLYTFKPDHTDKTYASPRTWEYASRLTKKHDKLTMDHLSLLSGAVSEGVAREFIQFCKVYTELPTIDQILVNPEGITIPEEPSILFALTGSVAANAKPSNLETLMRFITRLHMEWQVVCLRDLIRRDETALTSEPIKEWISKNSAELFE